MSIAENLQEIRDRAARAAESVGRAPDTVLIVAISKTFPVRAVAEAIAAGQTTFGENRVQEARPKIRLLDAAPGVEWHLVGHLQSNKARLAAELFHVIHAVDSVHLASKLSEACQVLGKTISVLVQVDLGLEPTKFGAAEQDLHTLLASISGLPGLHLDGLMTLPPYFEETELIRPYFRRLRQLRDELEHERPGCLGRQHLSMGMSHDFEAAIQEGASIVRIGTAIFGSRAHA